MSNPSISHFPTAIRIADVEFGYEDFRYRTPIKFGGVAVDQATLVNVTCCVETKSGKQASGFGSMPLGNVWSFPSKVLGYDVTLNAMKVLVGRIAAIFKACTKVGHPIDITHPMEPLYLKAARNVTDELKLSEPIPVLCTLVAASTLTRRCTTPSARFMA